MIIIEDLDVVDVVVPISEDAAYLVAVPAATTVDVHITMKEKVVGSMISDAVVSFTENTPSDDTITRDKGSWIDDGFGVGMDLTVSGSVSNDATYTIAAVTDLVITLDTGDDLADEPDVAGVTITGAIVAGDWFVHETVTAGTHSFQSLEVSPTALRFERTAGTGTVRAWVRT